MSDTSTLSEFWLSISEASGREIRHDLVMNRCFFVGSSSDCAVALTGKGIGDLHCLFDFSDDGLFVQDWSSPQGVLVNGCKIEEKTQVFDGDVIGLGDSKIRMLSASRDLNPSVAALDAESNAESIDGALDEIDELFGDLEEEQPIGEEQPIEDVYDSIEPNEQEAVVDQNDLHAEVDSAEDVSAQAGSDCHDQPSGLAETVDATEFHHELGASEAESAFDSETDFDESPDDFANQDAIEHDETFEDQSVLEQDEVSGPEDDLELQQATSCQEDSFGEEDPDVDPSLQSFQDHPAFGQEVVPAVDPWGGAETTESYDGESSASFGSFGDDDDFQQETINLLRAEIEDLRMSLAERDAQLAIAQQDGAPAVSAHASDSDDHCEVLISRIDELNSEADQSDEKFAVVMDLLEASEFKNETEIQEREALRDWLTEVEQRIQSRQKEWAAELEIVQRELGETRQQRDKAMQQLSEVVSRIDAGDGGNSQAYQEQLDRLQEENQALEQKNEKLKKAWRDLNRQLTEASEQAESEVQQERARLAKERADISRLRHELSQRLSEFEQTAEPRNPVDHEVNLRLRTLRMHLREIHEQERIDKEQRGESLIERISNLWKRTGDEY